VYLLRWQKQVEQQILGSGGRELDIASFAYRNRELCFARVLAIGRQISAMRKISQYRTKIPALAANSGNGCRFPCIGSMIGRSHR